MKQDHFAARIAAAYFMVAMVWILFSDVLVRGITGDTAALTTFQSLKGGVFVVATAVVLFLFVSRKIQQLEAARQSLAESAAYNELMMTHAADGLLILTSDGIIVTANEAMTTLTGYRMDELVGANINLIIPAEDLVLNPPRQREIAALGGKVMKIERRIQRHDGSIMLTEWRSKLLPNGLIQGMMRDISERIEDEAALRRHAERLQLLAEITGAFTEASDDYVGLAETIVHRVAETIGDSCLLCIANETGDHIAPIASYSTTPEHDAMIRDVAERTWFEPGKGPAGMVYSTGKAILVAEKFDHLMLSILPDWGPFFQKVPPLSILYVPMRARGSCIGVLILLHNNPQRAIYNEDDLNLAQDLADRAALAISNAQLLQMAQHELDVRIQAETEAQRNAARLQMLSEATSAFAEATGDYTRLADTITHRIGEIMGDVCMICVASDDGDGTRIAPLATYAPDPEIEELVSVIVPRTVYKPGESLVGRVFETGQPLLLTGDRLQTTLKGVSPLWKPFFDALPPHSMMYLPLRARGTRVGVLILHRHNPELTEYTENDLHLAQDLADRAALAISNAQSLQSAQHELAERIEAERALELSEGRFRIVADTFPMFIWMLDERGGLSYINKAWTTYTGLPVESAIGGGWGDAMHPDDRAELADQVAGFARDHVPFSIDFRLRRHDGTYRWMLSTGTPRFIEDGSFVGFVGSSIDLTERREAETAMQALNDDLERRVAERTAELTDANAQLRELDQMRSKFVAHVTHDLRNPVASLSMRLYIMARSPERYAEHVEVLTEQVERLKHLIDSVLDLSRIDLGRSSVQFEPVNFNSVVGGEVLALTTHAEDAGLKLICHLNPDETYLWGVPNQIAQVVANLVGNAIHYTPSGSVEVTTEFDAEQQMSLLRVRDTGLGIASEDLPHLFERFYRGRTVTENDLPGSGLGLSIVKEVVDIHHGRIEVESEIGKGTTFSVWLPAAPLTVKVNS